MKKLFFVFCSFLILVSVQSVEAQKSPDHDSHKTSSPNANNSTASVFSEEGFIKTPWATENKVAKSPTPVVQKKSFLKETKEIIESLTSLQYKYAMMLNVNVESLKNTALLGFMDDWFGTKYRYGGTTKKGIDCSALTGSLLLSVYGFALPRTAKEQYKMVDHIKRDELKEGDLVFFNTKGYVSHVGLYLDNGYFLHASTSQGVTISSLDETYYKKRFICGGRMANDNKL